MSYSSSSVTVLVLTMALIESIVNGESSVAAAPGISQSATAGFPDSWVSDMFYRALANFTVRDVGNSDCRKHSEMYEKNLRNYTSWAVRMAESWDRYPNGIIAGNTYHFGVYDECVQVHYPVRGQYCLSEIKLIPPTEKDYSFNRTINLHDFGNNRSWQIILGWGNYTDQIPRNILNIGICIPDSCSAFDLQTSLQKELDKVFNPEQAKAIVNVDPITCSVSGDMYPYNTAYYVTSTLFVLLALICCVATLHHFIILHQKRENETSEDFNSFISSFSLIKSGKELLKFDKNNELNPLNAFKFIMMLPILFGHRGMFLAGNPMNYPFIFENMYLYGPDIILSGMNAVDPFFFMSGYLVYVTCLPILTKEGSDLKKIASPIIYRIVRILPSYCAVIAFVAHIVPHLGDGPLWPQKIWREAELCKKYWWTNLLFINNFIDVKYQCLLISWYVSCDIHFFIVGIFILYVYTKKSKLGIQLLIIMTCLSFFVPFIITFLTKADGLVKIEFQFLEDPRSSKSFNEIYRQSYMRGGPFLIGLACAFIVNKLNKIKFKFSPFIVYGGTLLILYTSFKIMTYGTMFYERQRPYYPLENAVYSVMWHFSITIFYAWVCVCLFTTGYGVIIKVFNNRFVVPLGRLTFSVYLINLIEMLISHSFQRLSEHATVKVLFDIWIQDTVKCYVFGAILFLVVEAPFADLARKLFGRGPKKVTKNTDGIPIEPALSKTDCTP